MRRWFGGAAIALVALVGAVTLGSSKVRADPRDFTLINGSDGVVITHVYVAPSSSNDWGDDILGQDVLNPGESVLIYFQRFDGATCFYDIRVTGKNDEQGELYQVDLCSTDTVTFS
jgi:hypothetical protein